MVDPDAVAELEGVSTGVDPEDSLVVWERRDMRKLVSIPTPRISRSFSVIAEAEAAAGTLPNASFAFEVGV